MGKALITGSSGGLGRAIAKRLALDGFEVWLCYRGREQEARDLATAIGECGGTARLLRFDVASESDVENVLVPALSKDGPLDVLVNNAAVSSEGYMMMQPSSSWQEVVSTNLGGFFLVTRACLKGMVAARKGRIVNIGSLAGSRADVGQVAYAATKAALEGATRALAMEMARWNILVNTVAPGPLTCGMADKLPKDKIEPQIPLRRFGEPEEVAGAVSFLCGPDATYITGQVLAVNGGMGM
ncbi:MAG: SDR family oxidoreductase [Myxococcota bacterium]|jgi:3-oxoacyl-[acyl-carrier protein] reductase|nr:SDR family oxidoreductase [Myxococcota bacterium]